MPRKLGLAAAEVNSIAEVTLPSAIHAKLCLLAATQAEEVCGVLYGMVDGTTLKVMDARRRPNLDPVADAFAMQFAGGQESPPLHEGALLRPLGIFHSHPEGPPILSGFDCFFVERTQLVWVVIGRELAQDWQVRCYVYRRGLIVQLNLRLSD